MTMADYRKPRTDDDLVTPTALPPFTRGEVLALRYASTPIGAMNGMQFYRMCKTLLIDNPVAWRVLQTVFASEVIDEETKWYVVLELIRYKVVRVGDSVLVKCEKKEKVA